MLRTLKKTKELPSKKDLYGKLEPVDIPPSWKEHLYNRILQDTIDAGNFERYRAVYKAWRWIDKPHDTYWIIIDTLDYLGAASVKMILDSIIEDYNIDDSDQKSIYSMEKAIRRAMGRFTICRVITSEILSEEELGHTRYEVTIYKSPFCTPKQLELTKNIYINMGGFNKKLKKKKKPKSNEYIVKTNLDRGETFKREKMRRKAEKMAKMGFKFYKCPKCSSIIKISKDDESLYKIEDNKLLDPCKCGYEFREKIIA